MDDYGWRLDIVRSCPIWASDLGREILVEWIVEVARCDAGLMQVEYTRSPDVDRPYVSAGVSASLWVFDEEDRSYALYSGRRGVRHIGLAKRWSAAQAELLMVNDANRVLETYDGGLVDNDDDDEDFWGFDD